MVLSASLKPMDQFPLRGVSPNEILSIEQPKSSTKHPPIMYKIPILLPSLPTRQLENLTGKGVMVLN